MASTTVEDLAQREYKYGFVSDIEADTMAPGLNEDVVRLISAKKNEPDFMLQWRLKAYRYWITMEQADAEPQWAKIHYPAIDFQAVRYYSAPKSQNDGPKSLDEVDPDLLKTLREARHSARGTRADRGRRRRCGVRQCFGGDDVQRQLAEMGMIFCSFSEAVQNHPELIKKYLGSVVPYSDNFFAALNSAVFSDGSFCYIPKGVSCPMELSTYFRINAKETGQFERTLIVAEEGATRQLSRRLHRADARRESAARGGRRVGRSRRRA